jgi:predicted  nucleic acid-binding Zn-ribbon protein
MDASQLQSVVDAENKRLNEINESKALVRIREIHALRKESTRIDEKVAQLQRELNDLEFDSVRAEDIVGAAASAEA